ncbi:hypothetical protein N9B73_12940, partial [Verrucomicrobiales bacterium]|nr:hypothetical protein [Verrucomicrobiales bacterium]
AGAEAPRDRVIDGKDVWPVLTGEAKTPHQNFFYHRVNALQAIRSGDWKLHVNGNKPVALHNLATDIGEKKNVLAQNQEIAKQLLGEIAKFQRDIAENSRPAAFVKNPKPLAK